MSYRHSRLNPKSSIAAVLGSKSDNRSRNVEKLIILLDYSEGILARLHYVINLATPSTLEQLPKDIYNHLEKNVSDPTIGIYSV